MLFFFGRKITISESAKVVATMTQPKSQTITWNANNRSGQNTKTPHTHTHPHTTAKKTENLSIPTSILQVLRTLTHLLLSLFIFFHKFRITFILSDKIWAIKIKEEKKKRKSEKIKSIICVCFKKWCVLTTNENCLHLYMTSLKPMIEPLMWLRLYTKWQYKKENIHSLRIFSCWEFFRCKQSLRLPRAHRTMQWECTHERSNKYNKMSSTKIEKKNWKKKIILNIIDALLNANSRKQHKCNGGKVYVTWLFFSAVSLILVRQFLMASKKKKN